MVREYDSLFELGSGAFGRAIVVKHKDSKKLYVDKIIQVKSLSEVELDRCVTEVLVMGSCNHRNIIQHVEAFVEKACLHIIMQYAKGGDLHKKIEDQNGVYFSSEVILDWFVQIILALEYIHIKGILHRDLKPQNVFLTNDGTVKLGDFGIAKVLSHGDDLASTRIGTPFYISPEICAGKQYNSSSDMWAAGCLLFELTLLRVPFNAASLSALTKNIIQCQFDHIPRCFSHVIPSLISQLIVFEPEKRSTASQILHHPELCHLVRVHRKHNADLQKVNRSRSEKDVKVNKDVHLKCESRTSKTKDQNKVADSVKENICIVNSESVKEHVEEDAHYLQGLSETMRVESREVEVESKPGDLDVGELEGQDQQKQNIEETPICQGHDKLKRKSRSYSLKDSVIRKLSAASPVLAETVRLQRKSISENKTMEKQSMTKTNDDEAISDVHDEVFSAELPRNDDKVRLKSSTYTVLNPYKGACGPKVNDENNNSPVTSDLNSTLILALSVSRSNVDLARTILVDRLRYSVGYMRSEILLASVKQLVVEKGRGYSELKEVLEEGEEEYVSLVSMLLCL